MCLDFLSRFDTNLFHFLLCYVNDVFSSSPKSPEMSSICMCGEMTKLMDGHFSFGDALCPVKKEYDQVLWLWIAVKICFGRLFLDNVPFVRDKKGRL